MTSVVDNIVYKKKKNNSTWALRKKGLTIASQDTSIPNSPFSMQVDKNIVVRVDDESKNLIHDNEVTKRDTYAVSAWFTQVFFIL